MFPIMCQCTAKKRTRWFRWKSVFVDTEGTFSATRIGEIAIDAGLDPEKILENIYVVEYWILTIKLELYRKLMRLLKKKILN